MSEIQIIPLGAGQDVGKSCILISIDKYNIMLDCGMHMGYDDERRFPDFSYITKNTTLTEAIDCVLISHFHLDHCGALAYMSEIVGYNGPIYMSYPTKAIVPIMLEDYRKVVVDRTGDKNFFTSEHIKSCMKKVIGIGMHQTIFVKDDLSIKGYYAGHVLGALMLLIKVGNQSVLYTGDFNTTPDRHLDRASIDFCKPDVLITESTYATTIRDSKHCREKEFMKKVQECIDRRGKLLIPVFALGRAQELCILLETYWKRHNLKVPIFYSGGLTKKAFNFYSIFIDWTNQNIKDTFTERNMFDFQCIKPLEESVLQSLPGPMVVFATPGMLHAGLSLAIFKMWCDNPDNMIIMPGFCISGTIGNKILNGQRQFECDGKTIAVKMSVEYMSFSAHADAQGIMQIIHQCGAKNVVLVHGNTDKMKFLKSKIEQEFNIRCEMPENGKLVKFKTNPFISVMIPKEVVYDQLKLNTKTVQLVLHRASDNVLGGQLKQSENCICHNNNSQTMSTMITLPTLIQSENLSNYGSTKYTKMCLDLLNINNETINLVQISRSKIWIKKFNIFVEIKFNHELKPFIQISFPIQYLKETLQLIKGLKSCKLYLNMENLTNQAISNIQSHSEIPNITENGEFDNSITESFKENQHIDFELTISDKRTFKNLYSFEKSIQTLQTETNDIKYLNNTVTKLMQKTKNLESELKFTKFVMISEFERKLVENEDKSYSEYISKYGMLYKEKNK
ncbi:hypothetical protein A3Q56_04046, partial [Intoshia linei]